MSEFEFFVLIVSLDQLQKLMIVKSYSTRVYCKLVQASHMLLLLISVLLGCASLSSAQETCFAGAKYPKTFSASGVNEQVYSSVASASIGAIFVGGSADNAGIASAFIMRTEADSAMTKWRRFYKTGSGQVMNAVTGMAISSDSQTLAVHATDDTSTSTWSAYSHVFVIRTVDGGYNSDIVEVRHGITLSESQHVAFDAGMIHTDANTVFLAFMQTSTTMRDWGDFNNHSGRAAVAKIDLSSASLLWYKEYDSWGFARTLAYKNWGATSYNLIVGGKIDRKATTDSDVDSEWRIAVFRLRENGIYPADNDVTVMFETTSTSRGDRVTSATIDHMFIEDSYLSGTDWLFGSTRSSSQAQTGNFVNLWRTQLNGSQLPTTNGYTIRKMDGLGSSGYVVAISPTWDSNGHMHLVVVSSANSVYYATHNWGTTSFNAIKLHDNVSDPVGAFYSTAAITQSGLQVYRGYLGASMTTLVTPGGDYSRTYETASVLPFQTSMESCLTAATGTLSLSFSQTDQNFEHNSDDWFNHNLGYSYSQQPLLSEDAPVTTIEDDSWCSPAATPLTLVSEGYVEHGFCFSWDGVWRSVALVPPKVAATSTCIDTAPTWVYSVEQNGANQDHVKVQVDSIANLLWFKPQSYGSGLTTGLAMTVTARLPSGLQSSFTFSVVDAGTCVTPGPELDSPFVDQSYTISLPLSSYDPPAFTVSNPACPQAINYNNSISPAKSFINGSLGAGKLVSWETLDDADIGFYTITIRGANACAAFTQDYTLEVLPACDNAISITAGALIDQEFVITTAASSYTFDTFVSDPTSCAYFATYSFSVADVAGTNAIQSFDSATRTFTFHYDADVTLSGGPGVEFTDYTVTIDAITGDVTTASGQGTFNLRLKNPCFDPTLITIVPVALPAGPYSYLLFDYEPEVPWWFITHASWSYTTQPIAHQFCGAFTYEAAYEGVVATETSVPDMVYFQGNQTMGLYSEDLSKVGLQTTVTLQASLTDYPIIVTAPLDVQSALVSILDPCLSPQSITATPQTNPPAYEYTGNAPAMQFYASPFYVFPLVCPFTYTCGMTAGARLDLCGINDGTSLGVFEPLTANFNFQSIDLAGIPPGDYTFEITGSVGDKTNSITWTMTLVDPCPNAVFFLKQNPFLDMTYALRDTQIDFTWVLTDLVQIFTLVDCGTQSVAFTNGDLSLLNPVLFTDSQGGTNAFQVLYNENIATTGSYPITYTVSFDSYPSLTKTQTDPLTITIVDPCDAPLSVTPSLLLDQEYTITQASFDYTFPVFTADPAWCEIAYSHSVTAATGGDVVSFAEATQTFSIFEPSNLLLSGADFTDYTVTVMGSSGNVTPVSGATSFTLKVKNPCVDPAFISIVLSAGLVDQTYTLFDLSPAGLQWIHDPFTLSSPTTAVSLCGDLTYLATFQGQQVSSASSPMRYNAASNTFAFYSEDFSLLGPHTFTIEAYLTDYPTMATAPQVQSATITVLDPCPSPNQVTATTPQVTLPSYSYTGATDKVVFSLLPFEVEPSVCPFLYTCSLVSGPRTDRDLCNISDGATVGTFLQSTGGFTFRTIDLQGVPPGTYTFRITGTVGDKSDSIDFEVVMVDPCPTAAITLNQSPIQSQSYILRDPEQSQSWQIEPLYFIDTLVDCGLAQLEFFNDDAGKTGLDLTVFRIDLDPATSNQFVVQNIQDVTKKGAYPIKYRLSLTNYLTNSKELPIPFTITIVDPCDAPLSVTPSLLLDQEYTITQASFDYTFPVFTADPAWCEIAYSHSVTAATGGDVVSFAEATQTFSIFEPSNLLLSGADFTDYTVTVMGSSGNVTPVSGATSFTLKVKNPCVDPAYMTVTSQPLPTGLSYILYDTAYPFTHQPFVISADPSVLSICGTLGYSAKFDGVAIDLVSDPMTYDSSTLGFEVYSIDFGLLGTHAIQVQAYLQHFPLMTSVTETTTIDFVNPCLDPFSLVLPAQPTLAPYLYTGSAPKLTYQTVAPTVDPSVCPITYSCQITAGARFDLCSLADGSTQSSFNTATGRYQFATTDMVNYPAGSYSLEVTATSGLKSQSFTVELVLEDPCLTVDLQLQPSPFTDSTYVIRDPAQAQVWQAQDLISPLVEVDCGPIAVDFYPSTDLTASLNLEASLFLDDRSSSPVNQLRTLYIEDVSLKGSYPIAYRVYHELYPLNYADQTNALTITVTNACETPTSLIALPLDNQEYTITDSAFSYQAPAFLREPDYCDIVYSVEVSDPTGRAMFAFDANPDQRVFHFYYDSDVALAGSTSTDYLVSLKAELGTQNVIQAFSVFTLTVKNPCVDPAFVSIDKVALPTGLQYALWDFDPTLGQQFTHSAYTVTTQPLVGHALCGTIDYSVTFDGVEIDQTSTPMKYDTTTRTFEMYSEDFSNIGTHEIAVQGYFREYPSVKSALPDLNTQLEIVNPCLAPASISSSIQGNPSPYAYTAQGLIVQIEEFTVDPPVCPVTYECVSISGSDLDVKCPDQGVFSLDQSTGRVRYSTSDMAKYSPGQYLVTIRGIAGDTVPVMTETVFTMTLENPCPTALLKNLQTAPFSDAEYLLGDEAINQPFRVRELVELSTRVDCGPIVLDFIDQKGDLVRSDAFAVGSDGTDLQQFTVLEQDSQATLGEFKVRYRARLPFYPQVETYQVSPFTIKIANPPTVSNYTVPIEPAWLQDLDEQVIVVDENSSRVQIIDLGVGQDPQTQVTLVAGDADRFLAFDKDLNLIIVRKDLAQEGDYREWELDLIVKSSDTSDSIYRFKKKLKLDLTQLEARTKPSEQAQPVEQVSNSLADSFEGMMVLERQDQTVQRPVPYIADFTPLGLMTIAWDQRMKPQDPQRIPPTKVALKYELYETGTKAGTPEQNQSEDNSRRLSRESPLVQTWVSESIEQEALRIVILDALEVKLVSEESEESQAQDFTWDVIGFDEDNIWLQVDFTNPSDIGAFSSEDYITVTFWGIEFFKSFSNIEVELGYTLRQRLFRLVWASEAETIDKVNALVEYSISTVAVPLLLLVAMGGRLLPTWMFLNSLQLIAHTPLLPVSMPANLHYFLTHYLSYVRLGSHKVDEALRDTDLSLNMSQSGQTKSLLESLLAQSGYKMALTRDLVLVLFFGTLLSVTLGATLVFKAVAGAKGRSIKLSHVAWVSNFSVRFAYEFALEILLCICIQVSLYREQEGAPALWIFTAVLILSSVAALAWMVSLFYKRGPYIADSFEKGHLLSSLWGVRPLKKVKDKEAGEQNIMQGGETKRSLLKLDSVQAIGNSSPEGTTLYEGGSVITDRKRLSNISDEAVARVDLAERTRVSPWHKTLFYGLKRNHPHNVAIVHPLAFLVRRILYALAVTSISPASKLSGSWTLLCTCLFMLAMVASETPWVDPLINQQHFVNEAVFYLLCASLVCFSGTLTTSESSSSLGWLLIGAVTALIFYNIGVIVYDLWHFFRLLIFRYRGVMPKKMRSQIEQRRNQRCFCLGRVLSKEEIRELAMKKRRQKEELARYEERILVQHEDLISKTLITVLNLDKSKMCAQFMPKPKDYMQGEDALAQELSNAQGFDELQLQPQKSSSKSQKEARQSLKSLKSSKVLPAQHEHATDLEGQNQRREEASSIDRNLQIKKPSQQRSSEKKRGSEQEVEQEVSSFESEFIFRDQMRSFQSIDASKASAEKKVSDQSEVNPDSHELDLSYQAQKEAVKADLEEDKVKEPVCEKSPIQSPLEQTTKIPLKLIDPITDSVSSLKLLQADDRCMTEVRRSMPPEKVPKLIRISSTSVDRAASLKKSFQEGAELKRFAYKHSLTQKQVREGSITANSKMPPSFMTMQGGLTPFAASSTRLFNVPSVKERVSAIGHLERGQTGLSQTGDSSLNLVTILGQNRQRTDLSRGQSRTRGFLNLDQMWPQLRSLTTTHRDSSEPRQTISDRANLFQPPLAVKTEESEGDEVSFEQPMTGSFRKESSVGRVSEGQDQTTLKRRSREGSGRKMTNLSALGQQIIMIDEHKKNHEEEPN